MKLLKFLLILFSLATCVWSSIDVHCKDESGKPVDWFIVYKFPKISNGSATKEPFKTGVSYAFITSKTQNDGWTFSKNTIDDVNSIFGKTLAPIYNKKSSDNLSYIVYNDQKPPDGQTQTGTAHAKGVVVSTSARGFWLIHTIPKFISDPQKNKYEYPSSGHRNGQVGLCISMKIDQITKVINQLLIMRPLIYSIQTTKRFEGKAKNVLDLKDKKWTEISNHSDKIQLETFDGEKLISFSKDPKANKDLYADIVAPELQTNLLVQSWRLTFGGPGNILKSECKLKFRVENIKHLTPIFSNGTKTDGFPYTDDHSKWAMGKTEEKPFVCIGDINRVDTQFKRGGGTTCLKIKSVWKDFNDWVDQIEKC